MSRPKKEPPNHGEYYEVKASYGGERKSFYSKISKYDAKQQGIKWKADKMAAEMSDKVYIDKDVSFSEWANKWLVTYKKGKVKEHTYDYTYRVNVESYMVPFFEKKNINEITQIDIQSYFNSPKIKALADNNLKRHRTILKNIFEKAVYNDLCRKNPVIDIKYASDKETSLRQSYTKEQVDKLIVYAMSHKGGAMIVVMLNTGVRRSELLGLKWYDINYDTKTISIRRAITPDTTEPVDGDLKSDTSFRVIPISDDFIKFLKSMPHNSDYIIPGKTKYGYMSIDGFEGRYKRFMEKACNELGLPYLVPHELRHTFGTVLREKGVDIYTISKVLGHSDVGITGKIYVHNDIDVLRKNMNLDDKKGTSVVQLSYGRKFRIKSKKESRVEN